MDFSSLSRRLKQLRQAYLDDKTARVAAKTTYVILVPAAIECRRSETTELDVEFLVTNSGRRCHKVTSPRAFLAKCDPEISRDALNWALHGRLPRHAMETAKPERRSGLTVIQGGLQS